MLKLALNIILEVSFLVNISINICDNAVSS